MGVIFIIIDGLGDRPIKELNNKTPLEFANTPNMDYLAENGINGLMNSIDFGIRPGSDVSHLAIFGYDPKKYYTGRGVFEALGIGMEVNEHDIALRANFATVNNNGIVVDRRAGRISDTEELVNVLNNMEIDNVKIFVGKGTMHRVAVVLRGENLDYRVSDNDPHETGRKVKKIMPVVKSAEKTALILNKFVENAHEILKKHKLNILRKRRKKPEANYLLMRGASKLLKFDDFEKKYGMKACCIAGAGLYKGIAKAMGMDIINVSGADGTKNSRIDKKIKVAIKMLKNYDFVFVHIKYADNFAEDGDYKGKVWFIEKIDAALEPLKNINDMIVLTADHSTPCSIKMHSADPVPLLIKHEDVRVDDVKSFGERSCSKGGLGRIKGEHLMKEILNILGKLDLYGN